MDRMPFVIPRDEELRRERGTLLVLFQEAFSDLEEAQRANEPEELLSALKLRCGVLHRALYEIGEALAERGQKRD